MQRRGSGLVATAVLWAAAALGAAPVDPFSGADALVKPPLVEDPRRAELEQVVREHYPQLFGPAAVPGWVALTLLVDPDGKLVQGYQDETRKRPYVTSRRQAFEALGADPHSYRDRVQLDLRGGVAGSTRIYVRAFYPDPSRPPATDAAPARTGAPDPSRWRPNQADQAAPNDDPAVNRAIAEKYFPDLHSYTTPKNESIADFWVLLSHDGRVLATGRRYLLSESDLKRYLASLYPGIRTEGFQPTEFVSDQGRPAVVNFTWLAADSPVSDPARADVARRGDVALYAEIHGGDDAAETSLAVLRYGSSSIAVCDAEDLNLQVEATDGGNGTAILRARIQRVPPPQPATFEFGTPRAVESDWPAWSSPVRVRLGQSAEVPLTDQQHRRWNVVLHPDRLQGKIQPR